MDEVEWQMFSELVKRGIDQGTADQVSQSVCAALVRSKLPETRTRKQPPDERGNTMEDDAGHEAANANPLASGGEVEACIHCGAVEADHEPSGCCGDGGGSTFSNGADQ